MVGPLRSSSGIVGSHRKSSEIIRNCHKMAKNSLNILNKIILAFFEPFLLLSGKKNYCFKGFFTVGVKMPKIYLFHVTKPIKKLSV